MHSGASPGRSRRRAGARSSGGSGGGRRALALASPGRSTVAPAMVNVDVSELLLLGTAMAGFVGIRIAVRRQHEARFPKKVGKR